MSEPHITLLDVLKDPVEQVLGWLGLVLGVRSLGWCACESSRSSLAGEGGSRGKKKAAQ